ncbi:NADH dehydrogenase [ubiquinone] 1 beta subcomplex subunit 9 [Platanthera zijinensis]|uniref:NADH dehydrogenase [ubiquinone] 1 beta subcomplex subunit 9 n=1 Tax=Platanthera zijinensis TaxID=2320716 RepID=A0AAP0G2J5_9ASPA
MSLSTAGYVARRAAQKERVRILYRRALKDTLNWAVHRHLFYNDVRFSILCILISPLLSINPVLCINLLFL